MIFGNSAALSTTATADAGIYGLRLTADDGQVRTFATTQLSLGALVSRIISMVILPGYTWQMDPGPGSAATVSGDQSTEVFDPVSAESDQTLTASPAGQWLIHGDAGWAVG